MEFETRVLTTKALNFCYKLFFQNVLGEWWRHPVQEQQTERPEPEPESRVRVYLPPSHDPQGQAAPSAQQAHELHRLRRTSIRVVKRITQHTNETLRTQGVRQPKFYKWQSARDVVVQKHCSEVEEYKYDDLVVLRLEELDSFLTKKGRPIWQLVLNCVAGYCSWVAFLVKMHNPVGLLWFSHYIHERW